MLANDALLPAVWAAVPAGRLHHRRRHRPSAASSRQGRAARPAERGDVALRRQPSDGRGREERLWRWPADDSLRARHGRRDADEAEHRGRGGDHQRSSGGRWARRVVVWDAEVHDRDRGGHQPPAARRRLGAGRRGGPVTSPAALDIVAGGFKRHHAHRGVRPRSCGARSSWPTATRWPSSQSVFREALADLERHDRGAPIRRRRDVSGAREDAARGGAMSAAGATPAGTPNGRVASR